MQLDWIHELLAAAPRETAIEAAYYLVRELKQSSVPPESRKEHFVDGSDSEPTPEAKDLAQRIAAAIEEREGRLLSEIDVGIRTEYIGTLLDVATFVSDDALRIDIDRGRELLDHLRDL